LLQSLQERLDFAPCFRIIGCQWREHADAPHALALLRPRREGPRRRTR
jgi:hypothetical protein